jgi:hypothetical protein
MKKSQQEILKELFSYIFNDNTQSVRLRKLDSNKRAQQENLTLIKI